MTTDEKLIARCSIQDNKPDICKKYPTIDHYMPPECTYTFVGDKREGKCECNVGACCNVPREGGLPGGAPMPSIAGGKPCKYLVWVNVMDEEKEKEDAMGGAFTAADLERLVGGPE
jgi:hypothetical protein